MDDGFVLTQKRFTKELLKESGIDSFKHVVTPLPLNLKLHQDSSEPFEDPTKYRNLVGKFNFLTHTRPDLSFTVQSLSQYMQIPSKDNYQALVHTLNYVHFTAG